MSNIQWYHILVQDKYISGFEKPNLVCVTEASEQLLYKPLFEEFRSIISGLTLACAIGNNTPEGFFQMLAEKDLAEYLGYRFYLDVCPDGHQRFAKIWETIHDHCAVDPSTLSAEQVAVLILYPFWSRMGSSYEDIFARSGKLGYYLRILQQKVQEERAVTQYGTATE